MNRGRKEGIPTCCSRGHCKLRRIAQSRYTWTDEPDNRSLGIIDRCKIRAREPEALYGCVKNPSPTDMVNARRRRARKRHDRASVHDARTTGGGASEVRTVIAIRCASLSLPLPALLLAALLQHCSTPRRRVTITGTTTAGRIVAGSSHVATAEAHLARLPVWPRRYVHDIGIGRREPFSAGAYQRRRWRRLGVWPGSLLSIELREWTAL